MLYFSPEQPWVGLLGTILCAGGEAECGYYEIDPLILLKKKKTKTSFLVGYIFCETHGPVLLQDFHV